MLASLLRFFPLAAVAVFCLSGSVSQAQEFGRFSETKSNVAYFYHAKPGQATVQISVWGTVPRPGIYEVPDTTELGKLLTMAGGLPIEPRQENRDPAKITVRLYRSEGGSRRLLFKARADSMLRGPVTYPPLQENDIVVVETVQSRRDFGWRDVLSIASTLGTLTLLGLRILRFSR